MMGAVKHLALSLNMFQVPIKVRGSGMGVTTQQASVNGINMNLNIPKGGYFTKGGVKQSTLGVIRQGRLGFRT